MMKKCRRITWLQGGVLMVVASLCSPVVTYAFGAPDKAPGFFSRMVHQLLLAQFHLRTEMAGYLKSFSATQDLAALAPLFGMAFLYGVIHAAGPGHGKAVATAYMLHGDRKAKDGLLFGNIVAFSHGLSGVLTVLCLKWVIQTRISTGLKEATRLTSQISFSLILLLGLFLLISGIRSAIKPEAHEEVSIGKAPTLLAAVAFGMIPCPGVVTVMLLAMGLHLTHLGLLMALGITVGMAATTSAAIILVVVGKNAGIKTAAVNTARLPGILTSVSGIVLTALGGLLMAAGV